MMDWSPIAISIYFWNGFIFQRLEFCIFLQTLAPTVLYMVLAPVSQIHCHDIRMIHVIWRLLMLVCGVFFLLAKTITRCLVFFCSTNKGINVWSLDHEY